MLKAHVEHVFPATLLGQRIQTGAAPMWVPGAMAATSAAIVRRKPADAARAPEGPIKIATGVLLASMCVMMSRVESTRPPGAHKF